MNRLADMLGLARAPAQCAGRRAPLRRRLGLVLVDACCAVAVLALAPRPAAAGIEDSVGLSPRATALGGSYVARPGDFAAVYYNPAGLSPSEDQGNGELSFGLVWSDAMVSIESLDGASVRPAAEPRPTAGLLVGGRLDLGSAFDFDGLDVGFSLYVPRNLFEWRIRPDDEIQWLFLTDRTRHIAFSAGAGVRVAEWLSLGLGARVLFDVETLTTGRVTSVAVEEDPQTGETELDVGTQLGEDVTVYGRTAPMAGALVTLGDWRIGVAWRGEIFVDDWGNTRIRGVPGLGDLGYNHRFAHYFQPHDVVFGLNVDPTSSWSVSADLTWSKWSRGRTTNQNTFGTGQWGDTWRPSVGAEWTPRAGVAVQSGYHFVRAPFSNFGGQTNLLVNDRHVLSTGMTLDPWSSRRESDVGLRLSWALQAARLVPREEEKNPLRFPDDEALSKNPGRDGYRYGGWTLGGSLALEVTL